MKHLLIALLCSALLTACQQDPATDPEPSSALISSLAPSTVFPGTTLTIMGQHLAADSVQVMVDQQLITLAASAVPGGLQVTLPTTLEAGTGSLKVGSARTALVITPKLLRVTPFFPAPQTVGFHLEGLGWTNTLGALQVTLDGRQGTVTRSGGLTDVTLSGEPYGEKLLHLRVNGVEGNNVRAIFAAATVTGQASWPVQTQPQLKSEALEEPPPSTVLFAKGKKEAPPPPSGAVRTRYLPGVGGWQLSYASVDQARKSLALLQRTWSSSLTFDPAVTLDGQSRLMLSPTALDGKQWFRQVMGLNAAASVATGQGITVAVLDSGVRASHPDLQGRIWPGWNFIANTNDTDDHVGHGTHVSGLIAATGAGSQGQVRGAAPGAMILPVKVVDAGSGTSASVAEGLLWAAGLHPTLPNPHPAQIANLSLGTSTVEGVLSEAIQKVTNAGMLVVVATGNSGGPLAFPSSSPEVIAVTSVSGPVDLYQPGYANTGLGVDVAAVGGDLQKDQDTDGLPDGVLSTDLDSQGNAGYGLRAGTSMAAPQVAGILAKLLSAGRSAQGAKAQLLWGSLELGVFGKDQQFGYGLANAYALLGPRPAQAAFAVWHGQVLAAAPIGAQGHFEINSVLPEQPIQIVVANDLNGDGVYGHSNEGCSEPVSITAPSALRTALAQPLTLKSSPCVQPLVFPESP